MNVDMNAVKDFALDVWHDLKETGMAGVAVGMAITFVVISALVLKPGGPPEINTGYASATAEPTEEVALEVPGDEPLKISDIDLSAPRDPFQTMDQLESSGSDLAGASEQSIEDTTVASTGGGGGGTSESEATTVAVDESDELVPLDDLETADTTDDTTTSDDDSESSEPSGEVSPDEPVEAPATDYSYAADVQFGIPGSLKRYSAVQRLGFVPSKSNPMLMYLGVKADHETAVFMVDSRLSQGGEGKCVPKPSLCTFIEMSTSPTRDEHRFRDAEGTEYLLRFRGVVRTTAKAGSVGGPDLSALPDTPVVVDGSR